MSCNFAIQVENATVTTAGNEILHNISWQVKRGERCFILGANGAGKTTLVKVVTGFAWPKFGAKVQVLGETFGEVSIAAVRKRIAWVSPLIQEWLNENFEGLEMVLSGLEGTLGFFRHPSQEDLDKAHAVMKDLRCEHLANRTFHTMSSGEQLKILIARALLTDPELMILDEPSVYLDIAGREFLLNTIDQLAKERPGLTMVFITQRIEDILPVFDRGMILREGSILAEGSREEVLTEENLKRAFGLDIRLIQTETGRLWSVIR